MSKIAAIAKNTSYFTFALVLQKVISFSYFTLLARNLGPENLGKYYFAISLASIFAIFIDLGLANVTTRDVAKNPKQAQSLISSILAIKIPLAFLVFGVIAILINFLDYPALTRHLVYIAALCVILDSFSLTFFSVIRGFHNLLFESISSVVFQVVVMVWGLYFLYSGFDLRWVMGALLLASAYYCAYSLWLVWRRFKIKLAPKFDYELIKKLIITTTPFAFFMIFQKIYTFLDSVLLSFFSGDKYVGLYQIAFKIINALQFLPMAFIASLYPAFATYWLHNKEQLSLSFERSISYLLIISLPIVIGVIAMADKIILVFSKSFLDSAVSLRIIIVSLVFVFLNYPVGSLLNACDKQKANTKIMGIVLIASVIMNLILIPQFQASGASITVVATNFLMFVLGLGAAKKIISFDKIKLFKVFSRACAAAFAMGLIAFYLKSFLNIFVVAAICGVFYFGFLYLIGGFKKEDVLSILSSIRK